MNGSLETLEDVKRFLKEETEKHKDISGRRKPFQKQKKSAMYINTKPVFSERPPFSTDVFMWLRLFGRQQDFPC